MKDNINKNIAVLSMARNDNFFIAKWIDYYSQIFGFNNLFLILDGFDQPSPEKELDEDKHYHQSWNDTDHLGNVNRTKYFGPLLDPESFPGYKIESD